MTNREKFWAISTLTWLMLFITAIACLIFGAKDVGFVIFIVLTIWIFDMRWMLSLSNRFSDEEPQ